uniref:Uncharacterized protein n=1 Tax=viral metagenome TaxID=1070528 RepID=A0A6C0K2D9_9ZZZZ
MNLTITVLGGMAFFGVLISAIVSFCTAIGVICLLWSWNYFFPPETRMVCPCAIRRGGYIPTEKDKEALKKFKAGKSIGFTMRSSLKAKGLIPRVNGTKRVSKKYRGTRKTHG